VRRDPVALTNAALAEWVANELRKYEEQDQSQRLRTRPKPADAARDGEQELTRVRAVIAGQQAVLRDLPHVALTGDFSAAPTTAGAWMVRYAVRDDAAFGARAATFVECVVAMSGAVDILKKPNPRRT
jgi:hypothetical protein